MAEIIKRFIRDSVAKSSLIREIYYFYLSLVPLTEWYVKPQIKKNIRGMGNCSDVLDAGCGFGPYSYFMARLFPKINITALDLDVKRLKGLQSFFNRLSLNIKCIQLSLNDLNDYQKFDLILCTDVLEHIEDDVGAMHNLYQALKLNGKLLVCIPITPQRRFLPLFKERQKLCIQEVGHAREGYTQREIIKMLNNVGFKVEDVTYAFGFFGSLAYEIYYLVQLKLPLFVFLAPIYFILIHPFVLCAMCIDKIIKIKKGNGIIIVARK